MEKDHDLLMKLLNVREVASRTEVDLDTRSVRVLESQKHLEVPEETYGTVALQPLPPPSGSSRAAASLGEKKKCHHLKKALVTLDAQVTYTGNDVTSDDTPNPKRVRVTPAGSAPSLSLLAPPAPVVSKTPIKQSSMSTVAEMRSLCVP